MFISPIIIQWLIIGGASVCAFMIGNLWNAKKREEAIEDTITYLIENNYVRSRLTDGEHELIPLNED